MATGLLAAGCELAVPMPFAGVAAVRDTGFVHVVAVSAPTVGELEVRFDAAMATEPTEAAVRLYRLRDHAGYDPSVAGDPVAVEANWPAADRLRLRFVPEAGDYLLVVGAEARSAAGGVLDGRAPGAPTGLHRPDDDGLATASPYVARVLRLGSGATPRYAALPASPSVVVAEVRAVYGTVGNGPRDQVGESLYRRGESRVAAFPPENDLFAFELAFTSEAGHPYDLVAAGAFAGAVAIRTEQGDALGVSVDLSQTPGQRWGFEGARVVGVAPAAVTVDLGPDRTLTDLRRPDAPVWLLLGDRGPPEGLLLEIADYDPSTRTYRLALPSWSVAVTATGGTTVATDRLWLAGEVGPGYALRTTFAEFAVVAATGSVLWLAAPVPATVTVAEVALVDLRRRVALETPATPVSNRWYLHPTANWPPERILYLVLDESGTLGSVMGTDFFDEERDGDELLQPPEPDDRFVLQFALRTPGSPLPPVSRVADGSLYPSVLAADPSCLGPGEPVCVRAVADPNCPDREVPAEAAVAFYTSDGGGADPYGATDLLEVDRLEASWAQVVDASGRPLPVRLDTSTRLNQTSEGLFPTTILRVHLLAEAAEACGGGVGLRGFRTGDRLVLSHRIRPVVPSDPRTLDGDGDGVASASVRDDWVGVYDATTRGFRRWPRRPAGP